MPNIIQTKHGVYDVDTIFGCYSYLIRECGLSGDRCAMVNKLYVMANIAELGAEQKRPDGVVEALKECVEALSVLSDGGTGPGCYAYHRAKKALAAVGGE